MIQLNHLLDDLVAVTFEDVVKNDGLISALVEDPSLLVFFKISLVITVIIANDLLYWVEIAVSNVIAAFRNFFWTFNVVGQESQAVGSQVVSNCLCVETSVIFCAVLPLWQFFCLLLLTFDVF